MIPGPAGVAAVVPVHNGARFLDRCLAALAALSGPAPEVIVCDDGSTDDSAAIAASRGVRLVRLGENRGPSAARNAAARETRAGILLFVDADVEIHGDALGRVGRAFEEDPSLDAVFGAYDDAPAETNFCSQYKNLLHHFVHRSCAGPASTFWTGIGAIRRGAFEAAGGFDERLRCMHDVELGYRLTDAGRRIRLDPEIQGRHLKRWTFVSLVRADVFCRAVPWSRLVLERRRLGNELNLKGSQRSSALLLAAAVLLCPLCLARPTLLAVPLALIAAIAGINRPLYRFFRERRGVAFAARAFLMQLLYYAYSGAAFLACCLVQPWRRAGRRLEPADSLEP